MKKLLLPAALLLLVPVCSYAACKPTDFSVENFRVKGATAHSRRVGVQGKLFNKCATPAAAQIRVVAKDVSGDVVASKDAWPAGTSNIMPGKSVKFTLGRLFRYDRAMRTFSILVVQVRTW